jgi:Protein of unknown function (DUF3108)
VWSIRKKEKKNYLFVMKKYLLTFCSFIVLSAFMTESAYRSLKNEAFSKGEHVEYLVHYLGLSAGTATVDVNPKVFILNNRICYRVDLVGQTAGAAGALVRVNDTWRSYIDTSAFVSHRFFRHLEEGNYRREELTDFLPLSNSGTMKYEEYNIKSPEKPHKKGKKDFKIPDYVQDMVSGYYYIRTVNFDKLKEGDVFSVPGVLEDKSYNMSIRYKGREVVRTKFGKINAHRLIPIMPKNDLFSGENSVRFWVSDDKNHVPIRIEADMFIGKVVCELRDYKNLKHKINFQ